MMTFLYPWAFILLPFAILLCFAQIRAARRRTIPFPCLDPLITSTKPTWQTRLAWLPHALRLAALALLTTALARPQIQRSETSLEKEGIAIEMLIDVSSSMDMRIDYRGEAATRLEVAKRVLELFVQGDGESLLGRSDDLIGIISFARYADTICPLTLSHEAVVHLARNLSINDRPNEDGTAYGDATALAAARLSTLEESLWHGDPGRIQEVKNKIIVLLTDGENNCGRHLPAQAAALALKWGIRIYTISLTEPPRPRQIPDGSGSTEVASPRSAAARVLEQMATTTGGIYRTAHDYESLHAIYSEIDQLERSQLRSVSKMVAAEAFVPWALAAFLCLAADLYLRHGLLRITPE